MRFADVIAPRPASDPCDPRTGQMWRGVRDYAASRSAPAADEETIATAQATFERLQAWLT